MSLNSSGATELAERLGIAVQQLTRKLSDEETRAWSFYRRAARDPRHVWSAAKQAWRQLNVSDKQAAEIMHVNKGNIPHTVLHPHRRILTFEQALRLTTALNIVGGPELFLPKPSSNDHQPSR